MADRFSDVFTITIAAYPETLGVTWLDVPTGYVSAAFTVKVRFNQPIDGDSFTVEDLFIRKTGQDYRDIGNDITITHVENNDYNLTFDLPSIFTEQINDEFWIVLKRNSIEFQASSTGPDPRSDSPTFTINTYIGARWTSVPKVTVPEASVGASLQNLNSHSEGRGRSFIVDVDNLPNEISNPAITNDILVFNVSNIVGGNKTVSVPLTVSNPGGEHTQNALITITDDNQYRGWSRDGNTWKNENNTWVI